MAHTGETQNGQRQQAIEQIVEDERWRRGLTDEEAKILMNWGINRVKHALSDSDISNTRRAVPAEGEDQSETLSPSVREIRNMMRSIGYLVAENKPFTAEQLLEELGPYIPVPTGYKRLFGSFAIKSMARQIAQASENMSNEELIERLTTLLEKGN